MSMAKSTLPGTLAGVLALAAGCAGDSAVEATTVLAYNQCQGLKPGLTQVDYTTVASLRGGTLLQMSEPGQAAGAAETEPASSDTAEPLLVAVSRGPQPTPGYRLSLEDAQRRDRMVVLSVRWDVPKPDAVLAQMITRPCLVVALPRADFVRVEAVDQSGASIGSLDL